MGKKDKDKSEKPEASDSSAKKPDAVQTGGWDENAKIRYRTFNGPDAVDDPMRIAMTKEAYADLLSHAKESLDREICGVLLGDLCEDDYGRFLNIDAALRGGAAKGGGTHVTFTQETWNEIHKAKEERFPKLQIVGWYHSHPGFGVEFSDMDLFIQKNFFGGPGQIAFVTDPLGGQEAIDANVDGRIIHVKRFWVDGRERRCYTPPEAPSATSAGSTSGAVAAAPSDTGRRIDDLQDRIRQLTDAVEKQRNWFYNIATFVFMLIAACGILALVNYLWRDYARKSLPPTDFDGQIEVPMPVVDKEGKAVKMFMQVKGWQFSPELEQELWRAMLIKHQDEVEAMFKSYMTAATQAAATQAATKPASTAPATAPK